MTTRVAVATARYGDFWDELSVLANRLAGALACTADVDVLVPSLDAPAVGTGWDGACRLLRFPATAPEARQRAAWRKVALGLDGDDEPGSCTCPTEASRRRLPPAVEELLVLAEGGDAPALYDHLRQSSYDAVVFVGLHSPVTCFGMRALPEGRRSFLVPGGSGAAAGLTVHETALGRAERILVCTEGERRRMVARVAPAAADRIENIGFLLGVNTIVRPDASDLGSDPFVVVARDWRTATSRRLYGPWAAALAGALPAGVGLRLVGPGASDLAAGVPHTDARIDAWWWMSRALAVVDPEPHRVVGQEVLEALLFSVPVVVAANGEASREHAEAGNSGLWFRVDDELAAAVERLLDGDIRAPLGEQGRSYASSRYNDTDTYVKRVAEVILG